MLRMREIQKIYRTEHVETYALGSFTVDVREGEGEARPLQLPDRRMGGVFHRSIRVRRILRPHAFLPSCSGRL